jgi:hypothetical protein
VTVSTGELAQFVVIVVPTNGSVITQDVPLAFLAMDAIR